MNKRAFTLIELLVVVAIIGILAAVGVVAYNGYTASAKKAVVKTNLKTIEKYINSEMTKCIAGIEMEAYQKRIIPSYSCSDIYLNGTGYAFYNALNILTQTHFKDIKNPFNNNELILHQRWNKSGQGMPKQNEVGRIHCNFDGADAKGSWQDFIKNNIGGCDARLGTGSNDTMTIYFKTISDYDFHRAKWK
jgi:prepilin-type N-terminal cleavage/methylation domain-containing protein